jgi:hypothetical protein
MQCEVGALGSRYYRKTQSTEGLQMWTPLLTKRHRRHSRGGSLAAILRRKHSSVPAKASLQTVQLAACRAHSVALYISQISGSTLPEAAAVREASWGADAGGVGVHVKISAGLQAGRLGELSCASQ